MSGRSITENHIIIESVQSVKARYVVIPVAVNDHKDFVLQNSARLYHKRMHTNKKNLKKLITTKKRTITKQKKQQH